MKGFGGFKASCLSKCLDNLFPISQKKKEFLRYAAPGGKTAQLADYGFQSISLR